MQRSSTPFRKVQFIHVLFMLTCNQCGCREETRRVFQPNFQSHISGLYYTYNGHFDNECNISIITLPNNLFFSHPNLSVSSHSACKCIWNYDCINAKCFSLRFGSIHSPVYYQMFNWLSLGGGIDFECIVFTNAVDMLSFLWACRGLLPLSEWHRILLMATQHCFT